MKLQSYIAMLRGINVSGQKKIKMADLRAHLSELNFDSIQTYIQSGNIIFQSQDINTSRLEEQIKSKIQEKYGFEVPTLVKTPKEISAAIVNNPFVDEIENDPKRIYVTFLATEPMTEHVDKLLSYDYAPEQIVLKGKDLYGYSPKGFGNAKFSNNFIENKLKVAATTRNWRTVNTLLEMAENSKGN